MSERKNIDKLFQEKFKDFEAEAPETAWPELERRLKKKKDRKVIPIWWRLSGVAAALLLGWLVANKLGLFSNGNHLENEVVIEEAPKGKPETNGNAIDSNNGNPTSNEAVAEKDSATSVTVPNENAVAESSENKANTNDKSGNTNSNNEQKQNKKTAPFNEYQKSNSNRAFVNASADETNSRTNRSKQQRTKKKISDSKPSESLNDTPNNRTAVAQNDKQNPEESTVRNNGHSVKKEAVENQNNKTNPTAIVQNDAQNSGNKTASGDKTSVKKDAVPQNPNHGEAQNTAIAHKNTTDQKSSEAATVNQKTQRNQNNNTTDKPINQVAAAEDQKQVKKLDSTAIAMTVPNALEELLNEKENKVTKEPKLNRWQITSNIAPIYFGSTSSGSPIDSTFAGKSKDYNTQVSYGLGVNYAVNKRLTIRAGVNKVSLDYDTNNVELYASLDEGGLGNLDGPAQNNYLNFGKMLAARSAAMTSGTRAEMAALNTGPLTTDKFTGTISQKMGYIEVPVEVSYAVINRKLGVNVIAGVSTLFLNENEVSLSSEGLSTNLGEANNLNQTHFSTNVGLGVKYGFLKSFEARFEPIFKYQLNTFSKDSGDFKPYFFGLYTGVSFRF
ncbi:hypothetical protein [Flavobacterium sp.]|uniref:hypothetical protein n=1 Tax=Flavobacterium sp. TaxID=239 RepID=UPI0039E5066C